MSRVDWHRALDPGRVRTPGRATIRRIAAGDRARYEVAMHLIKLSAFALIAMLALAGCGDDHNEDGGHDEDSGHDEYGSFSDDCQAIIDACHYVEPGEPGEIHTCHIVNAHENNEEFCTSDRDRCVALCEAAAADAGDDDGGHAGHTE